MARVDKTAQSASILVCGYYGQGNLGDEAMLEGILHVVGEAVGSIVATVFSADPRETANRHGVAAIPLRDGAGFAARLRHPGTDPVLAMVRSQCFILGGGDLLRDDKRWPVAEAWLRRLATAQRLRRRCVVLGVSVGEIWRPRTIQLLREVLTHDLLVVVRDEQSRDRLGALDVAAAVQVRPDLAFYGPNLVGRAAPLHGRRRVALSVRSVAGRKRHSEEAGAHDRYVAEVAAVVDGLIELDSDIEVHLLPLRGWPDRVHSDDDDYVCSLQVAHVARRGHRAVVHRHLGSVRQLADECASLDLMIGTRLHALVLSAANSVPVIAISYDPKVAGFMTAIGQDANTVPVETLSADLVLARARILLDNPTDSRNAIRAGVRKYQETGSGLVDGLRAALVGGT